MQTFGNELVNLKRQQYQSRQPFQAHNAAADQGSQQQNQGQFQYRPNFQGYNVGNKQNINQRPYRPYNPAHINVVNPIKDIVPAQNNLAVDFDWCFPCNQPHSQATCSNGLINQTLMVQNATNMQHTSEA